MSRPKTKFEHSAVVITDQPVDDLAVGFKGSEGRFLILAHEPGVPNHIGGQDSSEPTLNTFLHYACPPGHVPATSYEM
jgi:hypothetical protein